MHVSYEKDVAVFILVAELLIFLLEICKNRNFSIFQKLKEGPIKMSMWHWLPVGEERLSPSWYLFEKQDIDNESQRI